MVRVGIIGGAGYTAGELLRILVNHPEVEIKLVQSESQAGKAVSSIHKDLLGEVDLNFVGEVAGADLDVVFLCKGHGESKKILEAFPELLDLKIIDLSQDFRLKGTHDFVYGLPEVSRYKIAEAKHVANPGCFATSIQLGILPATNSKTVEGDIHISGITGSTGAGQSFSATSHFSWRSNNASVYKPFVHQHLLEIGETVRGGNSSWEGQFNFVPYRGAFTRGIITTSYFTSNCSQEELQQIYEDAYQNHPFTVVTSENPDLKMVVNTNKAVVYPQVVEGKGMVISVIDNLLKGASGQAVQNMNLMNGIDEQAGLNLKSGGF